MATWASKLRKEALDNATVRLNAAGKVSAGGIMEPFSAGTKGGAPSVFYVDGNVVSSGNGLGWLSAVKTLSEGLALAHAYQSTSGNRAWAHRATVYACGDTIDEDLIKGAEKSDIIGVGTNSGFDKCGLTGNHAPVTTSVAAMRMYNFHFTSDTAGILWDLIGVSNGMKFIDCDFSGRTAAQQTRAVRITASTFIEIAGCRCLTAPGGFSTAAIEIGAGNSAGFYVHDSFVVGTIGVLINASATAVGGHLLVDKNVIRATTLCFDDNSNLGILTNNTMISAADNTTLGNCVDYNEALAANNIRDDTKMVPIHST